MAAVALDNNRMFLVPDHIFSAVYVLAHNPASSHFSSEDIWLQKIRYLTPGHAAPGINSKEKGSRPHLQPLPSTTLRCASEAATAQTGQGLAQGHPAVNLLPWPGLFPWHKADWPHSLGGAAGTHILQPAGPRATQVPPCPLLL